MSKYVLHLLKRKITLKSEIKSALSQTVWKKKMPATMEGLHGIFLLYTDAETRPFGFRKGTDRYAGKNDLYSLKATQQRLLGDACCPQREFILFVNYI